MLYETVRLALISVHYRMALAFSEESLAAAGSAIERLDTLLAALSGYQQDVADEATLGGVIEAARRAFEEALDDDLNISAALAAVFDLVRELNRRIDARTLSTADARAALDALLDLDRVLGVMTPPARSEELPDDVAGLLDRRAAARAARDWEASDHLRDQLAKRGIAVEDTRDGQRWRRSPETIRA